MIDNFFKLYFAMNGIIRDTVDNSFFLKAKQYSFPKVLNLIFT